MEGSSSIGTLPPGLEDAQLIAHGGFASVYRAWQPDFHRQVAVKVLAADAGDPEVRSRFEREVRAMGAVSDHPGVVPVYDAGITDDRPYLVMPYLAGGSFDGAGPLDPEEVARVGIAVADALDAAHRAGLLHRDVKPANILRTQRGEPKLADFGVARFADATATHGQLALTLAYAAPELLRGEPASPASDVYSLGATLHALLRGSPPFAAPSDSSPMAMAMRVVSDEAPDLGAAGVPGGLAAVVERAMSKDPAARYPSAAAMREALEALDAPPTVVTPTVTTVRPEPTALVPPTPAPAPVTATRSAPPRRRAAWLPLALVGLVILGVLAAAYVAATANDDKDAGDVAASSTTSTPPDTSATTEAAPSTSATTEAPPQTTATTVAPAPAGAVVEAARDYFALLDAGDIEAGWSRLSPRYQEESGRSSYFGFWETISSVEVLDARPAGDDGAIVDLRFTRDDGSSTTETNTLRFISGDDGELLIDGSS
jgi:serine/threonine-protein kinase PknK